MYRPELFVVVAAKRVDLLWSVSISVSTRACHACRTGSIPVQTATFGTLSSSETRYNDSAVVWNVRHANITSERVDASISTYGKAQFL